ncbi:hypothetical protein [Maritalea sp.]|uniref:hypothetical protein n=1 Tax=Maritalea sp. TaxID=2003361 RepID=UPI003EF30703
MLFIFAAIVDLILFILHVAAIFIGAPAYLFLRAGKRMAKADQDGERWPAVLTGFVSTVFLLWALICFWASTQNAFADWARYLVVAIGLVFILRGGAIAFQFMGVTTFSDGEKPQPRDFIFSACAICIGLLHLGAVFAQGLARI